MPLGAQTQQHIAQQSDFRKVFPGDAGNIEIQIEVDNAAGAFGIDEHRNRADFLHGRFIMLRFGGEIALFEFGKRSLHLFGILTLLPLIEDPVLFDIIADLFTPGKLRRMEFFHFSSCPHGRKSGIGNRGDDTQLFLLQQTFFQKFIKISLIRFIAQRLIEISDRKIHGGITVIQPGLIGSRGKHDAGRFLPLPVVEFHLVENRFDLFPTQSFFQHRGHRRADHPADVFQALLIRIADHKKQIRLKQLVDYHYFDILTKMFGKDCLFERCFVGAGKHGGKHPPCQLFFNIFIPADDFRKGDCGLVFRILFGTDLITHTACFSVQNLLGMNLKAEIFLLVFREETVDLFQRRIDVEIAVEEGAGIGRMVKPGMRGDELLIGKIRDLFRIAARDKPITAVGEETPIGLIHDHFVYRRERSLHLIEHDALEYRLLFRIADFIMPSLLIEDIRIGINGWMQYRIQVYIHQIEEILRIPAGNRINGFIRICHGIQKCLHA